MDKIEPVVGMEIRRTKIPGMGIPGPWLRVRAIAGELVAYSGIAGRSLEWVTREQWAEIASACDERTFSRSPEAVG